MVRILTNEIIQDYNKSKGFSNIQNSNIITPFEKLCKRLNKDFIKKKLIGDIFVSDEEFFLLVKDFKTKYGILCNSYSHKMVDIPMAVTLVQIGVRYYDGKYWPHVADQLELENINGNQQGWIGDSFVATLIKYNKIALSSHEKVNNILMHSFISNYYVKDFFDFLFNYYRIDLDRDITRFNSSNLNFLIEIMIKNDNRNRTYLLKQQTADAIRNNVRGSKIRVRRFLKLIDSCFWDDTQLITGNHRLTQLFNKWRMESTNYQQEYKKYHTGLMYKKGRKCFASPYLSADLRNTQVRLVLPPQLVKLSYEQIDLCWVITVGEYTKKIQVNYSEAVTGIKTMETSVDIENADIFKAIIIELINNGQQIAIYKEIKADCVRFFDEDGDYIPTQNLPVGKVYAYTDELSLILSPGLVINEVKDKLNLHYFEFQKGDIARLPDGTVVSVGKEFIEGLSQRSVINDAYVRYEDKLIPLYRLPPFLIIKIAKKKVYGTRLIINSTKMRLFDMTTIEIPLYDRNEDIAFLIDLKECGCSRDGIYSIIIDVPNDKRYRNWSFALINNLSYKFEDSPYIFSTKGTISFSEACSVKSNDNLEKNKGENSYNFELSATNKDLCFTSLCSSELTFFITVPVLRWKFDNEDWEIVKPESIWHSNFPKVISFTYPEDTLSLCLNVEIDNEEEEEHIVTYGKIKGKGVFECDTTSFFSWFSRDEIYQTVYLKIHGNYIPFIDVITRSDVLSCFITADFVKGVFNGEFNIIGKAEYYVDIFIGKELLCEKTPIIEGRISIPIKLCTGQYRILVFESEDDETGFGLRDYYLIREFEEELINPYNLEGKTVKIAKIKSVESSIFSILPSPNYIITDLKLLDENNSKVYCGIMLVKSNSNITIATLKVIIEIYDLNKLHEVYICIFEDDERISFLYDYNLRHLVKYEDLSLPASVRYRRYQDLYEGGYYFVIDFIRNYIVSQYEIEKAASKAENYPSWYSITKGED